jgi:hypothetical protein
MLPTSPILLSTAYLPPVQYVSKFVTGNEIFIEKHENYQKQSFRNRCYIYGANGRQCLVIPVKKQHGKKMPIAEVEIDYTMNWQKIHVKSIESAYRLSAFYEYYADDLKAYYEQNTRLLIDWNADLLGFILQALNLHAQPLFTGNYTDCPENCLDFRNILHPKNRLMRPDTGFIPVTYQQAFQERYGFIPNLSVIDLLFNEGPLAIEILKRTTV